MEVTCFTPTSKLLQLMPKIVPVLLAHPDDGPAAVAGQALRDKAPHVCA